MENNKPSIERLALAKHPNGKISAISYDRFFGDMVWIESDDKIYLVSSRHVLLSLGEGSIYGNIILWNGKKRRIIK